MSEFLIKTPEKKEEEETLDKLDKIKPTPIKPTVQRVPKRPRVPFEKKGLDKAFEAANKERKKAYEKLLESKKELRLLINCLGYGHKEFLKYPQYKINTSVELKTRIDNLIDIISNPELIKLLL